MWECFCSYVFCILGSEGTIACEEQKMQSKFLSIRTMTIWLNPKDIIVPVNLQYKY